MPSVAPNLTKTYSATPTAVADARHQLAEFAAAAGALPDQVEAVRLAASEAVTNGVLHAYRGTPGSIYVHAAVVGGELWVLVSDDGCGVESRPGRPGLGLGLGLISKVSDACSVITRSSGGTEVRIRFKLAREGVPAAAPAPRRGERDRHRFQPYGFSASVATA